MPIVGKFFPSQKSQEKVFLLLRRHWFTYLGFLFLAIVTSVPIIGLIVASINNPDIYNGPFGNVLILVLSTYLLVAIGAMLYGFIDYYLDVYIVTNERIVSIAQNGFFRREISELHLHQIQDVSAKVEGIFPTMIHYGDVYIQTAGERENFIFKSIPNPYRVSKLIVDLHEAQLEEGEREQAAEQGVMQEYKEEKNSKVRDQIDLENIDPKTMILADKRTKDFIKGGPLEETDLKTQVQQELESQHYDKLLEKVKGSPDFNSRDAGGPDAPNISSELQAPSENSPQAVDGSTEGEMEEDQKVDL